MLYAALGDSITYGYSASCDAQSFVARVRRTLAKQQPVSLYLSAKPGWTSRQLRKAVLKAPECIWDEARLVTILVGGNDLMWSAPWLVDSNPAQLLRVTERLYDNLTEIVECVARPRSTLLVGTLYNPFPNSLLSEEYTVALNKSIRRVVQQKGVHLIDIHQPFLSHEAELIDGYRNGQIRDLRLRGNPVHPNDAGHAVISKTVLTAYRRVNANRRTARRRGKPLNRVTGREVSRISGLMT